MGDTPTIATYVSDMLALEQHTLQPLQHQADDKAVQAMPAALRVVQAATQIAQKHEQALSARLEALGGHAGSPIKSSVASALGGVAAVVGNIRKTEVAKYLRDDYTALCLATASYTMLQTTALAMHDAETAALAKAHLADYAGVIMKFSETLPSAVIGDLQSEGTTVDASVVSEAQEATERAWSQGNG